MSKLSKQKREAASDWVIVVGAAALLGSLFLTWSHQFSPSFLNAFGTSELLSGVPHNPTGWQVYSVADVVLASLAVFMLVAALLGNRLVRICALGGALIGVAFTLHAVATPPTNGANIFNPALSVPEYASPSATAGPGETVAIVGLGLAVLGLAISFTAD